MHRQIKQHSKYDLVENRSNSPDVSELPKESPLRCIIWRLINAFMVIFFLMAAFVQINDPDPYIWIPVYTIPALLSGAIVWKPTISENFVWRMLCIAHLATCIAGALYLLVLVIRLMTENLRNPLIFEEGRELAGLVITTCWLAIGISAGYLSRNKDPKRWLVTVFLVITCIIGVAPLFVWSLCFVDSLNALTHCVAMETISNSSVSLFNSSVS